MNRRIFFSALLLTSLASAFGADAPPGPAATPPPVKKVVLYKHGIGFFERSGSVKGDATISLAFKTEEMKDILTSLFVLDLNGGKVNAVLYDTKEPLSKQLEGILISVPENSALSQFLVQLKGAKISVTAANEKLSGRVMGVEPIVEKNKDGQILQQSYKLVLLTDAGVIRSVDLYSITELSLQNPELQKDLERLLSLTIEAKNTDRKTITIEAKGDGERELRIGYLVEQPIWKASYRMIFDKDPKVDSLIQGWAMAENNTEDDWKDVDLSFVAGNPLSYIMDLYTPYYPQRPTVPIPGLNGLAVNWGAAPEDSSAEPAKVVMEDLKKARDEESGMQQEAAAKAPAAPRAAMRNKGMAGGGEHYAAEKPDAKPMADLARSTMAAMATGTKVGELFSYDAKEKVSIPRGKAALVPIISEKAKGERVVYYKAAFSPKPVDAYVLKNETSLTLEAGAIAFFENGTSLGNGILSHVLVPGAKEIVPYALDASISVTPAVQAESQPAYKGVVANGYLTLTSVETLTSTWKIANKGKEDQTVLFDQPINAAYKLIEPAKPEEEVESHYRFRVVVKPDTIKEFKVIEKRDIANVIYLANMNEEQIRVYAGAQYLSDKTKQFLKEVAEVQAQRTAVIAQIRNLEGQRQRLSEEQQRLRENLRTLGQTPKELELRAKWVTALSDTEDKLVKIRGEIDEAQTKQRTLDEQLAKKVNEFRE
jgi:hypothetical protein